MAADSSAVASAFAVFATNVSPTVPEAVLRELFGILGTLKSLETRPGPRGAVTEAVVEYEDLDAALTALKLSGVELGGRPMVITAYLPASASPPSLPSGALLAQHDPAKAEEIVRTAYVGNVANSVNESELKSLFESCGPIVAIKVAGDAAAPTRFAFVEFGKLSWTFLLIYCG